ncbi:hypothetical protein C8K30_1173 [Promicromonospora sp. AC04]|nr:hypothetical protein C8K30_1173 [Promicromonospora sp. AC04]
MMADDPATLVEWLTALATAAAVVVALTFGGVEFWRGRRDRAEQRAERRISQAALVNAWLEVHFDDVNTRLLAGYRLHNASTAPVYSLVTVMPKGAWPGRLAPWGLLTPTDKPREVGPARDVGFDSDADVQLEFTFRDAAGTWWRRTTDGLLHELKSDPYGDGPQPW